MSRTPQNQSTNRPAQTDRTSGQLAVILLVLGLAGCFRHIAAPVPPAPSRQAVNAPNPEQILRNLTSAEAAQPDDPAIHVELAMALLRSGDRAKAEMTLRDVCAQFPRYPRAPYQLGMLLLAAGRDREAVSSLKLAAALAPDDAEVQANTALTCFHTGLAEDAKRYANAAVLADPQYAESYLLLGRIYDEQGTAQAAMKYVRRYLELSPNPAPGFYLMGRLYSRQASRDSAETWLRRAVDADPGNAEYWTGLGRVYCELFGEARMQEGLSCFNKALSLDPSSASAHQYLGQVLLNQRQYEQAAEHLRAALRGSAQPGPLYYTLGQALLKSGHVKEGQEAITQYQGFRDYTTEMGRLTHAIDKNPTNRPLHYALVHLCLKYRQYRAAASVLREATARFGQDDTLRSLDSELRAQASRPPETSSARPNEEAGAHGR